MGHALLMTVLIGLLVFADPPRPARASAPPRQAIGTAFHARSCPAEDDPSWNWVRCGNGRRGIVTMWGTPKVVSCGEFRWLARHGDLDPRTPWIVGDYSCGRRHSQDSVLNY